MIFSTRQPDMSQFAGIMGSTVPVQQTPSMTGMNQEAMGPRPSMPQNMGNASANQGNMMPSQRMGSVFCEVLIYRAPACSACWQRPLRHHASRERILPTTLHATGQGQ